ncbi:MAG: Xaa-Pro peptidase family protein [Planctomycetes bacterium]|nr:Xaa-Pro peptidase family protein [Planctomycetota bacterium]
MTVPRQLAFPVSEYQRRIAGVQRAMAADRLDLVLATTMASVCYLTGLESVSPHKLWLVAIPREGPAELLCQDFESHNCQLSSWLDAKYLYGVRGDPHRVTADMVRTLGFARARIGLEMSCYSSLGVAGYLVLKGLLPDADFTDATGCVPGVMAIKSAPEIEYLREAGRITRGAMMKMIDAVKPGATDNDIAAVGYGALVGGGAEYSSYPVIVTTGRRSGVPHSTFHRVPIGKGDPVFIEIAAAVQRYHTPMMRTAVLGEPAPLEHELAGAAIASVEAMIRNIRPGAVAGDVAAQSARELASIPDRIVWHGIYGYSVGLGFPPEWSDHPGLLIRAGASDELRPGMVFHCSTSLRDAGVCGATCSETILVTENGCEVLTDGPRELFLR